MCSIMYVGHGQQEGLVFKSGFLKEKKRKKTACLGQLDTQKFPLGVSEREIGVCAL